MRELGDGAPFAQFSSMVNSILIVVLVPIIGVLTQKISAYRMVTVGSFISALSVFFLAVPPAWFKPLADGWLGNLIVHQWLDVTGAVNPLYISIFLFHRRCSRSAKRCGRRAFTNTPPPSRPKARKRPTWRCRCCRIFWRSFSCGGSLSGWLLANYCPETGARNPQTMWLIIGGMALVTPLGAILFRKYIQVHEAGR